MKPDYSFKLAKRVENYITENKMIRHGDSVIIGLSGGADSVCLFLLLNKLKKVLNIDLHAIHINHGIRGESADRDELFCKKLCEEYDVKYCSYSVNVIQIAKEKKQSEEEAGRNVRYDIFANYARMLIESGSENVKVAVAHHKNDQAETVLFNMVRGSGLKGIGGMSPINERVIKDNINVEIIRPLLCLCKNEIVEFLKLEEVNYCNDETNEDNEYSRNLIRNEIIPELIKIQPKTVEHISAMADDAREAIEYINDVVEELYDRVVIEENNTEGRTEYSINVAAIKKEKPIIVRQLIIFILKRMIETYKDITKTHIEDIYSLINKGSGKYVMIPYGIIAKRDKTFLRIKWR